jgi:23S rRNA (uracil1939-C5)-methyltransferase
VRTDEDAVCMTVESLVIDKLGQRGDGVASSADGPVYVAGTLPGERVTAEVEGERGRLVSVDQPSPERIAPFCPLFGTCGGCATQHASPALYGAWKRDLVVSALAQSGLTPDVAPLVAAHGEGRRRVTFHARAGAGAPGEASPGAVVGFMAARSHRIVPIPACPLLAPGLAGAPDVAARIARLLAGSGKPLDIQVTATQGGGDVDVRGLGPPSPSRRAALVGLATALGLARLSVHGDVVAELRPPAVLMGGVAVVPPSGGFLQATEAGEEALIGLVLPALAGARKVADLFAGAGPFALRIARQASVRAVEADGAALAALDRAARHAPGLRPIETETRDLFRRPLVGPELAGYDAVVLDPPRAGAEAQARALAASAVPTVAYVSCSAATFARDARSLVDGGYALASVTPVDQFWQSAHVEIVGIFTRPVAGKRGPRKARGLLG